MSMQTVQGQNEHVHHGAVGYDSYLRRHAAQDGQVDRSQAGRSANPSLFI